MAHSANTEDVMGRRAAVKQDDNAVELLSIKGIVDRLFYSSPLFTAGKLVSSEHSAPVSFTCKQQLSESANVILRGEWTTHEKFGRQFQAESVEHCVELDTKGLALWLEKNGDAKGIGKSKARRIAEAFGEQFDQIIIEQPERIQEFARLNDDQITALRDTWEAHRADAKLITWLASFELSLHEIDKIREKYGDSAYSVLKEDPYQIIREIERFGFKKVDKIALKMGISKHLDSRIWHGVKWIVREAAEQGDTYIETAELVRRADVLLELDRSDSTIVIDNMIESMVECSSLRFFGNDQYVVDSWLGSAEALVYQKLKMFGKLLNVNFEDWQLHDNGEIGIRSIAPKLNDLQFEAVQTATKHRISLISGGAGTGKTFTVNTIRLAYESQNLTVGLCAPTGKAARRLEESTGHAAHTIHRLLKFNPRIGWEYNADNPLSYDCVICDEVSMVDSVLAYRLFSAIDFSRTALILVGDHHQLPPVGPGNLLRDLIQFDVIPTTILTEVVRQAGALKQNCSAILNGTLASTVQTDETGQTPWQVLRGGLDDAAICQQYVVQAFDQILINWPRANLISDIQLLTPQKDRDLGTRALNVALQRVVQKRSYCVDVEPLASPKARPKFYVRDKVIQTKNDYDLDVMNGTIGSIDNVTDDGTLYVQFDGREDLVKVTKEKQHNLGLAYALTIHKSQGSEFPMVLMIAHRSHSFMANRSLLYTGATRAKKKLIIIGDSWGIRNYLTTEVIDKRKTFLSKLLKGEAN